MPSHLVSKPAVGRHADPKFFIAASHPTAREFVKGLQARGALPGSCLYVSTPITTGPLSLDPIAKETSKEELTARNIKHARQVVKRVSEASDAVVIDPTEFEDVEGWEQPNYHTFWLEIIEAYVSEMVFCDGWEYSTGCCIEFASALQLELPRMDEHLRPLANQSAVDRLGVAIARMEASSGFSTAAQREARNALVARLSQSH